ILKQLEVLKKGISDVWEAESPSKFMLGLGEDITEGFRLGLADMPSHIETVAKNMEDQSKLISNITQEAGDRTAEIQAKLKPIIGGLGEKGKLTIDRPKELINVSFNITLDSSDVKSAITGQRNASIVTRRESGI
ncbi:MAG: hypothetical protein AABY15_07795, partial [Nanoarchaeota archaeon]